MRFRFIHAADLHLDSPLLGLARKSRDLATRVDDASRRAFDNLIALAIGEECRLLVIAGDLFDGQWRDYRTGQFFASGMGRLREHGVRVIIIFGNHDAENRFAARLELSSNVTVLSKDAPRTILLDDIGAAVHGQSFPRREVLDNIALAYPRPLAGRFNIGLLHTACSGRDGHANYAPCDVEQLANHGYQYWALGHVHAREVLCTSPHIVFSGNLQGRSIRETGPKGASLVTVEDGAVVSVEHRALDTVRFAEETLDISIIASHEHLLDSIRGRLESAGALADGRALALRLNLIGAGDLHAALMTGAGELREEIETLMAGAAGDIWLEKLNIRTSPPAREAGADPAVAGDLRQIIGELAANGWLEAHLLDCLTGIGTKVPEGARRGDLLEQLKTDGKDRAIALAMACLEKGQR